MKVPCFNHLGYGCYRRAEFENIPRIYQDHNLDLFPHVQKLLIIGPLELLMRLGGPLGP
jgi:hypothetical protein